MKATLIELQLHEAIKDKDDLALSKLYELCGDKIVRKLASWYRNVAKRDDAMLFDAVNEAFLGYYRNAHTFDPKKSTLQRFLEVAADRDLKNLLQKEKKHALRKDLPENVELQEKFWNSIMESYSSTDAAMITEETMALVQKILEDYFSTDRDIDLAKAVIAKERETEVYAAILEIEELTIYEQRKEVKKHKDRISKVVKRNEIELKIKNAIK